MSFNQEDLQVQKEGVEGVEAEDVGIQSGWSCHSCKAITLVNGWDLSWNNNGLEICDNYFCRHVRCELCQNAASLDLPPQQDYVFTAQGVLANDHLMGQPGDMEPPETVRKSHNTQPMPLQSQSSRTEQLLASPDASEVPESTGGAALDEIMQDLLIPKPSEAMMAAILENFLDIHNDPEAFDMAEDVTKADVLKDSTQEDHPETPPAAPPPPPIPCPHHQTHACPRTFHRAHHAKRHAQIHTHHIPCPAPRCASRFSSQRSLRCHTARIHDVLQGIMDLDALDKGALVADKGADGTARLGFPCRFRAVLGCERRFGQNGHANRHALGHCRRAWRCGVGGCDERYVLRANWDRHRWRVHGRAPWE